MTSVGARRRLAALSPQRRGVLLYLVASLVFVAADSLTKSLVADAPVVDVVLGRNVSYLLAVLILSGRASPRRLFVTRRPGLQVARGIAMFLSSAVFFFALSLLPLGVVSALTQTSPLFVLLLAGPLLGERVTRTSIAGAVIGFSGVLVLTGVDIETFDVRMLVPIGMALAYALYSIMTRALRADDPDVTIFYSGVVGIVAAVGLSLVVQDAAGPTALQWGGIALVGLLALLGHRLLVAAFASGRASDLAPIGYLGVAWSFLIGAAIFGEPIAAQSLLGAAAIAAGGILALRRVPPEEESLAAPPIDRGDPADISREQEKAQPGG
jgi:drug/metabolite transporter (DMT)-like permease